MKVMLWLSSVLQLAGRVLWLIPAEDEATGENDSGASSDDEEDLGLFESGGKLPVARAAAPARSQSAATGSPSRARTAPAFGAAHPQSASTGSPSQSAAGAAGTVGATPSGGRDAQTPAAPLSSWVFRNEPALSSSSARPDHAQKSATQPAATLGSEQSGRADCAKMAAGGVSAALSRSPARLHKPAPAPGRVVQQRQGAGAEKPAGEISPGAG